MFREERTESMFRWEHIGDIEKGRPNLGSMTSVAVYRLMQFTLRDEMIREVGAERAARILYAGGKTAGLTFVENLMDTSVDFPAFISQLQMLLKDLNVGILRMEDSNLETMEFVLTIAEDLDCSGLPVTEELVCTFDEGFVAGVFERYTRLPFIAKEIDCWCTGDRVCRFEARAIG